MRSSAVSRRCGKQGDSMGVIVAAPTCGSWMPGTVISWRGRCHFPRETVVQASGCGSGRCLFRRGSDVSAEVAGCQAECGAGSGIAAALTA